MIGCSFVCMAQDRPERSERGPGQNIEQMVSELGLNDKQTEKLKTVFEEMKPGRNGSEERPSREEMEKKRTEMDAKIKAILTDEQYTKYQEMRKNRGRKK